MALVPPSPAEDREIGNRDVAAGERNLAEPPVEHAVKPARFLRIALEAIAPVLLVGDLQEMVHLAGHRAKAAHLPHEPFQHRHLPAQVAGPKFAGLLAKVNEDRAGLENVDGGATRTFGIDNRRDLAVGADLDKSRVELLAF